MRYPDLGIRRLHFIFFLARHVSEGPKGTKPPVVQGGLQGLSNRLFSDSSHFLISLQHLSGLEDAVLRNIQAVAELSDLVRTSFGPNGAISTPSRAHFCSNSRCKIIAGRNKLLINHLGKLFVTSDAATIIREIEVVHPAAKLLVMASQAQEAEVRSWIPFGTISMLT